MANVQQLAGVIARRGGEVVDVIFTQVLELMFFALNRIIVTCITCRKLRVKRSIKVPAISNKLADIPPDEYSWRKYGQKPIKGSPHPRYDANTRVHGLLISFELLQISG